jgi:hypothetical protein
MIANKTATASTIHVNRIDRSDPAIGVIRSDESSKSGLASMGKIGSTGALGMSQHRVTAGVGSTILARADEVPDGWRITGLLPELRIELRGLEPKVAGPSMLGIGCPDRHAFLFTRSPLPRVHRPRRRPPARAGSFFGAEQSRATEIANAWQASLPQRQVSIGKPTSSRRPVFQSSWGKPLGAERLNLPRSGHRA